MKGALGNRGSFLFWEVRIDAVFLKKNRKTTSDVWTKDVFFFAVRKFCFCLAVVVFVCFEGVDQKIAPVQFF